MSSPAREARLAAAANGFTQVVARGDASIITKNPSTGKIAIDTQVGGGWHYAGDQETNTAWEADSDNNYLKMVKALYNIRARKLFSGGDLLKWTDPASGQYVTLQPNNLSWIDNVTGSQQFISFPASVSAPSISDDVLTWTNGYGTGRHFRYTAGPLQLTKHLIIDSSANLPAATVSNPYLELAFVMTPSSGVSLIVNGSAWDKKTTKSTVNAIEFRTSGGVTLWSFSAPIAHDSADSSTAGIMQLRKQGANLIVSVRFPKTWINAATFPIYLDPTLDYQVGASGDDGFVAINTGGFFSDSALMNLDRNNANYWHSFARFAVTIPVGATITSAYISLKLYYCGGSPAVKVYAEKAANPAAPTTASDLAGRTRTTACLASWAVGYNDDAFHNSGDLASVLTELMGSYSYASDAAMLFIIENAHSTGANVAIARSYDYTGNVSGPKLHIEYTEAPTDPEGSLVAGKLIRGGLLLHGVLGRS